MGQVPRAKPWLLLGDGRLATHLATYLRHLGVPCHQWSRRQGWLAGPHRSLDEAIPRHDRVLVALADDALEDFVARHRQDDDPPWIHFSGSRTLAAARGAHPLCAFGPELYPAEFYLTVPFVLEAEGPKLDELLPGLPNPSARVPAAEKALYHALCVLAGNFTTILWQRFFAETGGRWGLAPRLGRPYLRRIAANLESAGVGDVLTGPIARGDRETIDDNLAALESARLPELAALYRSFLAAARRPDGTARESAT